MAQQQEQKNNKNGIDIIPLGSDGVKVSRLGYGCMGLSTFGEVSVEDAVTVIGAALDAGINYFDTGDFYGCGHNEGLLAKAIEKYGRDRFVIGVKTGLEFDEEKKAIHFERGPNGSPEFIKQQCEKSLKRLGIETIDVYMLARLDQRVPIETTIAAMVELKNEGKIRHIALSEIGPETLRKANKVHPITAVQIEYSMWTTDPEKDLFPVCRELGVGILAYGTLGHGFLSSSFNVNDLPPTDFRRHLPRFQAEEKNRKLVEEVEKIAKAKGISLAQLATAWVHRDRSLSLVSIPGTKRVKYLQENVEAMNIQVTEEEDRKIKEIFAGVEGTRYHAPQMKFLGL